MTDARLRVVLVAGGVLVLALFLGALIESVPPPRVHVAVIAEAHAAPTRAPYIVRLSAVDVGAQRAARVTGAASVGGARAPIEDDVARVPVARSDDALTLDLEVGHDDRQTPLRLTCPLRAAATSASALWERAPPERPVVSGVRVRRVGLTLEGRTARVSVEGPDRERLALELLVDGALREARLADVAAPHVEELPLPPDVAAGSLVVAHLAEPWPLARGVWAAAVVGDVGPAAPVGQRPATLRPAPLACDVVPPAFPHALRVGFEAAAVVFVLALVAGLWWRSRAEPRRGALLALVSGAAVAALLGGLDLMLRLGLTGAP